MPTTLAAQLYTVRNFLKTPADIAASLKRVKQAGYDAVQLSGLGPIDPKELARMLKGEGLTCCATHVDFEKLRDNPEAIIEEHRILGCNFPAIGGMPWSYNKPDGYPKFIDEMSKAALKLKAAGMTFGYHNHNWELARAPGGRTVLDLFIENTDPAAWIRKVAGRIPLVHFKDMAFGVDNVSTLPTKFMAEPDADYRKRCDAARAPKAIMAEVGEGNLNWPAILDACRFAGAQWHIVEQDLCQRDPFESLAISLRNLKAMGLR